MAQSLCLHGILVVTCVVLAGCRSEESKSAKSNSAPPPDRALVRVAEIRFDRIAPLIRAVGNIRPRFTSIVASGAQGIVEEFPVAAGDFVQAGSVLSRLRMVSSNLEIAEQQALLQVRRSALAELRTPRVEDVAEAQARLQAQEAVLASARRQLEELTQLSRRGAANPSEVDDAVNAEETARQNTEAARAAFQRIKTGARPEQIAQAEAMLESQQKHIEFLQAEQAKRITRAPMSGFLVEEHTYVGQWLSKGDPVVTLVSLDEVEIELKIDQQNLDEIVPGRPVSLVVKGSGVNRGERRWTGNVTTVIPRSEWKQGSRSFPVIVRIRNEWDDTMNPPLPALREGMMAEVEFQGQPLDAILVPKDSIVRSSRGAFINVINPPTEKSDLIARRVMVEVGIASNDWIQVIGEGLAAGQQVITEGTERVRPFGTVSILTDSRSGTAADGTETASGGMAGETSNSESGE